MIVKLKDYTLYLRDENDGTFTPVPIHTVPKGAIVYSLDNEPLGTEFYFKAKRILPTSINTSKVDILSGVTGGVSTGSAIITVDEVDIEVSFIATNNLTTIVNAINGAVVDKLGVEYSNFASVEGGNRIRLQTPFVENTSVIIYDGSLFAVELGFTPGYYAGDVPKAFRNYVDDGEFVLVNETVTPNNGTPSGKFVPIVEENGVLKYMANFDRSLVESNPRLNMLVDGMAYMFQRLDTEIDRFISQVDLSNVDPENIENIAYLFGINLDKLVNSKTGVLNAREVLKSIMRVIQLKGTNTVFEIMMKFSGLVANVIEYRPDGSPIDTEITDQLIDEFFRRFLYKDSEFRNPILNYGSIVNDTSELPANPYDGEVIKALSSNEILQYDGTTWLPIFTTINPINGLGTEPDERISEFNWKLQKVDQPYLNISIDLYNTLKVLSGFDILPGDGSKFASKLREYDPSAPTLRAEVIGTVFAPFNMSDLSNRKIVFVVDEETVVEFDASEFPTIIPDLSNVTIEQLKTAIEQSIDSVVVLDNGGGRIVIRSKRSGRGSGIRIVEANTALGLLNGTASKVGINATQLRILAGTANPSEDEVEIPQVSTVDQIVSIEGRNGGTPDDGIYTLYVHKDGDIVISSSKPFMNSMFIPEFGYVSRVYSSADVTSIGNVTVRDGQIAFVEQSYRQSDFIPSKELSSEQESIIRGFLRSKLAVANRPPYITEMLPFDPPFYLRDGSRNTLQTNEPGVDNRVTLSTTPINDSLVFTVEDTEQILEFIRYIRPVHIILLSVLLNVPEIEDYWPLAEDRNTNGPYMPGFWDGSQRAIRKSALFLKENLDTDTSSEYSPITDIGGASYDNDYIKQMSQTVDGVNQSFDLGEPPRNAIGNISTVTNDDGIEPGLLMRVTVDGVQLTAADFTVSSSGVVTVNTAPNYSISIEYLAYDGKYPWELDIKDAAESRRSVRDGFYTSSLPFYTSESDRQIVGDAVSNYVYNRENRTLDSIVQPVANSVSGSITYDLIQTTEAHLVHIKATASTPPSVGSTFTINLSGASYSYTVVTTPSSPRDVAQGSTSKEFLENLAAEINTVDGGVFTTEITGLTDERKELIIRTNPVDTVFSVESTLPYFVAEAFSPRKRPMMYDDQYRVLEGRFEETATTAFNDAILDNYNANIPYYNYSSSYRYGHTNWLTLGQPDYYRSGKQYRRNDTVISGGTIYRALTSTSSTPPSTDWESLGAPNSMSTELYADAAYTSGNELYTSQVEKRVPQFFGSENYDGGALFELSPTSNNYAPGGNFRNRGMHDRPQVIINATGGAVTVSEQLDTSGELLTYWKIVLSSPLTVGTIVTGDTSLATGEIVSATGSPLNEHIVKPITGIFITGETVNSGAATITTFEFEASQFIGDIVTASEARRIIL